jgi:predicted alpha-1,6-mannanase (GH76 family)
MLVSEFIDRTGYQPTAEEYAAIEHEYYHFKGDKDQYCRAWAKANPTKAGTIWKKQKEQARREKVFNKVLYHIQHRPCTQDNANFRYFMDYQQQQAHMDCIMDYAKAKDRKELREIINEIVRSTAIMNGLTPLRRGYVYDLEIMA